MFNAAGSVTSAHAHETVALKIAVSSLRETGANIGQILLHYDKDRPTGIYSIDFLVSVANDDTVTTFNVGTPASLNNIVDDTSLRTSDVGTLSAGDVFTPSLQTTLTDKVFKHGGRPVVPAGTPIQCEISGLNAVAGYIQLTYWTIHPTA